MSNLNPSGRLVLLLLPVVVCIFFIRTADCVDGSGGAEVQWQIVSKLNYSSQIRLHPRLILLVTIPWSGESRSLMKELAHVVANDDMKFGPLKLMVLYKNVERALADALGATDEITFFYYQNTVSYRYRGKLRVQNILSSVQYVMSSTPDELPFKSVTTPEELRAFVNSTDKAVLLLEFCGWTLRLLSMNETMNGTDLGKGNLGAGFNQESSGTLVGEVKDAMKGMESGKHVCDIDNGFSGIPWTDQFTSANDSLVKDAENLKCTCGDRCTTYEYQQFEVFFEKLIIIAREFFLPPERVRFAVIQERSLLPLLHIQEPVSWLLTVRFAGFPSLSKILNEADDLRNAIQTQVSPVVEVEATPHDAEITLPAKRPALLLFVDRLSNLVQIRRQSREALEAFKGLAQHTETSNLFHGPATLRSDKTAIENKHPKPQSFSASQKLIIQDKMSVMVMDDGQQFTLENIVPDLQGSSVQDVLNYVLNQKKRLKLSALAKDKGFQLLSQDFDVDVVESLPPASADQSNQGLGKPLEGGVESAGSNEKQIPAFSSSTLHDQLSDPSDVQRNKVERKEESLDTSSLPSVETEYAHQDSGIEDASAQGWNDGETSHPEFGERQEHFMGSFFVCDGQYRLLETLTGGSRMPSIVIVDPISQEHYLLDEKLVVNHSLLSASVNDFLAGKLHPYIKSSATVPSSRDGPRPPFVNLDFHETDSIPFVNAHTFSELILGNRSNIKNSDRHWNRNILVLFSNNWCGFCQRMELVVREVYRAVKAYTNTMINSSRNDKLKLTEEYVEDAASKLPLIYMMDCTQNDCGSIIKPIGQRELFPQLLLFPADRKNVMPYEGDIAVSDIIKFLAAHGSDVLDLIMDKSLQQDKNMVERNPRGTSPHEVLLKERSQNDYQTNTQIPVNLQERPQLFPGSILFASEKLLDAHPFEESKILIVKADQTIGFRGLIFNKPINWDSAEEFVQGLELLKGAPLSFGGPVVKRGMPLVALTRRFMEGQSVEVLPDVYFVDQSGVSGLIEDIRSGNQSVHDYWFFLGYASWGWEQMFLEIAQGAWNVSQGSIEKLEWP